MLLLPLIWVSTLEIYGLGLVTHIVDLLAFTAFIYFTDGPTSPFFVYYVFSLFCAALRWHRYGTFWTAAVVLGLFIGLGIFTEYVLRDPAFELNRFIIRSVYLAVAALLLGYMSTYEQGIREELARLALWPAGAVVPSEPERLLRETLAYAAKAVGAPRALMVWEAAEEPCVHLGSLDHEGFQWVREAPGDFEPLVAAPLGETDFLCPNAQAREPQVLIKTATGFGHWQGPPVHPKLRERFRITGVLSLRLHGEAMRGWLLFMDKPAMTSDDLLFGEIVARQVTAILDRASVQQRLHEAALTEERIRFARDLHDGLLQSLAGLALQLESVRQSLPKDSDAQERLAEIQGVMADEQRALRAVIQQWRPAWPVPSEAGFGLDAWLADLAGRIERQWGLSVELSLEPTGGRVPGSLLREIQRLLQEALVNSAKHARATLVRVHLGIADGRMRITVRDNGRGFPVPGRYELAELIARRLGPESIRERIALLGGQLSIDSGADGASLDICLPLQAAQPELAQLASRSDIEPV